MNTEPNSNDKTPEGEPNPLSITEAVSAAPVVQAIKVVGPVVIQNEPTAKPAQQQTPTEVQIAQQPLRVHVTKDDELSAFERRTVFFGIIGIFLATLSMVAATAAGIFIYDQFREMEYANTLNDISARRARYDSDKASITTAKQLSVLQGQLTQQRNTMILDERARINISAVTVIAEVGKPLRVNVGFQNSGKTPARKVVGVAVIDPVPRGKGPDFDYRKEKLIHLGQLAPNFPDNFPLIGTYSKSTGEIRPLTTELHDAITTGNITLYFHGIIRYSDIFGVRHWVRFCYFAHTNTGSVALCRDASRNDEDQNPN